MNISEKMTHYVAGVLVGTGNERIMMDLRVYSGNIAVVHSDVVSSKKTITIRLFDIIGHASISMLFIIICNLNVFSVSKFVSIFI